MVFKTAFVVSIAEEEKKGEGKWTRGVSAWTNSLRAWPHLSQIGRLILKSQKFGVSFQQAILLLLS